MVKITDSHQISELLYKTTTYSKWNKILRSFVTSSDFTNIITSLYEGVNTDERFAPGLKYIFKPFEYCPLDDLKVVFIADEPYNDIGVSNGLAFSNPTTNHKSLPLVVLHSAVARTVYNSNIAGKDLNSDLKVWAEQGILLLNSALTSRIGYDGMHKELWKSFTSYVLDMINSNNSKIAFVFFGEYAQEFSDLIDEDSNLVLKLDMPGSNGFKWENQDMFNKINNYLSANGKNNIAW